MKRTEAHVIDECAIREFRDAMPAQWVVNDIPNDYGNDFSVETVEFEMLTGITFLVQLKGKKKTIVNKSGSITHYLEWKHADYYADKVRQPVFLIVIDVTTKLGYWIFAQEYILRMRKDKSWKVQKKAAIHVPLVNLITASSKLESAVHVATDFMSALRPVSIRDAIAAQIARIEGVDGRFTVRVDFIDNKEHVLITPKPGETVTINLKFKGDREDLEPKLNNLFGKGLPTSFKAGELEVQNVPFISDNIRQGATLTVSRTTNASVRMYAVAKSKRILSHIEISGVLAGGMSETRFQSLPVENIFNCKTTFKTPKITPEKTMFNLNFNPKLWDNVPILNLSQFDILDQFFKGVPKADFLKTEYYSEGNVVFAGTVFIERIADLLRLPDIFAYIAAFRTVCRLCNINPPLSERIDDQTELPIFEMVKLLQKGKLKHRVPECTVTMSFSRESVIQQFGLLTQSSYILSDTNNRTTTILGQEVDLGIITIEITDLVLTSTIAEIQSYLFEHNDSTVPINFTGGKNSTHSIIRRKLKNKL